MTEYSYVLLETPYDSVGHFRRFLDKLHRFNIRCRIEDSGCFEDEEREDDCWPMVSYIGETRFIEQIVKKYWGSEMLSEITPATKEEYEAHRDNSFAWESYLGLGTGRLGIWEPTSYRGDREEETPAISENLRKIIRQILKEEYFEQMCSHQDRRTLSHAMSVLNWRQAFDQDGKEFIVKAPNGSKLKVDECGFVSPLSSWNKTGDDDMYAQELERVLVK